MENGKSVDLIVPYFLKKGVTPLKLQKLLYYTQLWYFVKYKQLLFTDVIEAWIHGPVIKGVWDRFKFVKRNSIIPTNSNRFYNLDNYVVDKEVQLFLDNLWYSYGHLSGSHLVELTHKELPWVNSRNNIPTSNRSSTPIIIDEITTKKHQLDDLGNIPFVNPLEGISFYTF